MLPDVVTVTVTGEYVMLDDSSIDTEVGLSVNGVLAAVLAIVSDTLAFRPDEVPLNPIDDRVDTGEVFAVIEGVSETLSACDVILVTDGVEENMLPPIKFVVSASGVTDVSDTVKMAFEMDHTLEVFVVGVALLELPVVSEEVTEGPTSLSDVAIEAIGALSATLELP